MKLSELNEGYEAVRDFHKSVNKYASSKGEGNINKDKSTGDPDKTELQDRSGNQQAVKTMNSSKKKLLGVSGNSRDSQSPTNLSR